MKPKTSTQKDYVKTALRLPPDLHALLHEVAKECERTFNAEILHRLRSTFNLGRKATVPKGQQ